MDLYLQALLYLVAIIVLIFIIIICIKVLSIIDKVDYLLIKKEKQLKKSDSFFKNTEKLTNRLIYSKNKIKYKIEKMIKR